MLEHIQNQVGCNSTFIYDQFTKQMDKTISEAKGEIEAFCERKMHSIALAAIAEKENLLLEDSFENPIDMD